MDAVIITTAVKALKSVLKTSIFERSLLQKHFVFFVLSPPGPSEINTATVNLERSHQRTDDSDHLSDQTVTWQEISCRDNVS